MWWIKMEKDEWDEDYELFLEGLPDESEWNEED